MLQEQPKTAHSESSALKSAAEPPAAGSSGVAPPPSENPRLDDALADASLEAAGVDHHCRICPTCGHQLASHRCKLICTQCGYYLSCADYY